MAISANILEELKLLSLFNLSSTQEGLKIHHDANEASVAAAQRLFDKGLTDQKDGGYLTHLGVEAAQHAQKCLLILRD